MIEQPAWNKSSLLLTIQMQNIQNITTIYNQYLIRNYLQKNIKNAE